MRTVRLGLPAADRGRVALESGGAGQCTILTIPAKRPIKPVYVRKLMAFVKDSKHG